MSTATTDTTALTDTPTLTWVAGYVDAVGDFGSWTRGDGRTVFRLTVSVPDLVAARRLRDALGAGTVEASRRRPRLRLEGRHAVSRALQALLPHLRVRRADAEQLLRKSAPRPRVCAVSGCQRVTVARGVCATHYSRAQRLGMLRPHGSDECQFCGTRVAPLEVSHVRPEPGGATAEELWLCPNCHYRLSYSGTKHRLTETEEPPALAGVGG